MGVSWITALALGGSAAAVGILRYFVYRRRLWKNHERLDGKTVLVTGGSAGVGKAAVCELARRGARVIIACRNVSKGFDAIQDIRKKTREGEIIVRTLDLASFDSIRVFCDEILREERRLDVLINNAGVYGCPLRMTEDGFEEQFGVNHLGHFLLTNLLLELLTTTPSSRVIVVSSTLYKYGKINFDDLNYQNSPYSRHKAYSNSKLANVYFARMLHQKLDGTGVSVHCVSPGFVASDLARHIIPTPIRYLITPIAAFLFFVKTPFEGSQSYIYCCVAKELEGESGGFYSNCQRREWATVAKDNESAIKLWKLSESLVDLEFAVQNRYINEQISKRQKYD